MIYRITDFVCFQLKMIFGRFIQKLWMFIPATISLEYILVYHNESWIPYRQPLVIMSIDHLMKYSWHGSDIAIILKSMDLQPGVDLWRQWTALLGEIIMHWLRKLLVIIHQQQLMLNMSLKVCNMHSSARNDQKSDDHLVGLVGYVLL